MDSSTSSMPPASNALDAAFVNTAFSQQSPHGDSYGIPHRSASYQQARQLGYLAPTLAYIYFITNYYEFRCQLATGGPGSYAS